jgi:transcriptional regulator with XRE-family HTH domain
MKTDGTQQDMSADLRAYLDGVPELTEDDLRELDRAAKRLEEDPDFHAEVTKGLFVEQVLQALAERGESQVAFAKRFGKSRQYLSKILNEDRRVNFTVETMCRIAHHLGRKLKVLMLRPGETARIEAERNKGWEISRGAGGRRDAEFRMTHSTDGKAQRFPCDATHVSTEWSVGHESTCLAA